MSTRPSRKPFAPEVRERAVRLVREQQGEHPTQWAAIQAIVPKIGCSAEALRTWVRRTVAPDAIDPTIGFRCAYDAASDSGPR